MTDRIPTYITTHDWRAIEALLRCLWQEYSNHILTVTLFGSKARGDDTPASDIDVLIIVADEDWRVKHEIRTLGARVSLNYDVLFNLYVIEQERWLWMGEISHPLHRRIRNEGVDLTPVIVADE